MQHQLVSSSLLLLTFCAPKAIAHNIQTNVDVGVTFHVEPNHSPIVGETSQAWFALTRRGGALIPLSKCDCKLKVYLENKKNSTNEPILNPDLIAISPEEYQNIPGANLIFPQPGIYQLELTGKPTTLGDFTPFQVSYPVTVKPSLAKLPQADKFNTQKIQSKPEETKNTLLQNKIYPWAIAMSIIIVSLFIGFQYRKN